MSCIIIQHTPSSTDIILFLFFVFQQFELNNQHKVSSTFFSVFIFHPSECFQKKDLFCLFSVSLISPRRLCDAFKMFLRRPSCSKYVYKTSKRHLLVFTLWNGIFQNKNCASHVVPKPSSQNDGEFQRNEIPCGPGTVYSCWGCQFFRS